MSDERSSHVSMCKCHQIIQPCLNLNFKINIRKNKALNIMFYFSVGLLVSTTMYVKDTEYYRENLFYFKLDSHCYGLLPCLGRGKRSFHPVYLHGNKGEGHQPGWYVYMRDGHNGIICVQLHETAL